MKDQHRSLLAAALSFLVLIGWYYFYGSKQTKPPAATVTTAPAIPPSPLSQNVPPPAQAGVASEGSALSAVQPVTVTQKETPLMSFEWTNHGGRLSKIFLKNYRQTVEKESPSINLLPFEGEKSLGVICRDCSSALPPDEFYRTTDTGERKIAFMAESTGLRVTKTYDWSDDGYLLNLRVAVENTSENPFRGRVGLGWRAKQFPQKPKGMLSFLKGPDEVRSFLYKLGQDVEHVASLEQPAEFKGEVPWAGIEDRYFLISLVSRRVSADQILQIQNTGEFLDLALYPSEVSIPAQGRHEETYSFYIGPKERTFLMAAGAGLETAVDYGWFSILAIPILKLLKVFHSVVKNWGLAVIVLTLFLKLVTNPLTAKSMKQMKEMQKLQPKLTALKEKYKDDRQRLNAETMALFRTHKINPMGGCLPMLIQMPIYIALYKVIYNAIELYHAPFVAFYRDLSAPDPYFILPVLLGIAMVAQQKLTPSPSADPTQKQMMMLMPIMFTAFMLFLPMGLVLYIFVNTIASVLQQWMHQKGIRWRDLLSLGKGTQAVS